jgi:ATP-dependent DNA helicase RecG
MYPEDACREALINAVAHRDYSVEGEPVEIAIFDDRMEVRSPGGLLSSMTVTDLKELKRAHESRNVFVARVLRELGYMREMGEGMRRIFASIRKFDLVDPELHSDRNRFTITLFHRSVFSQKDIQWLQGFSGFSLTKGEERLVLSGCDEHLLSTAEIMEALGFVDTEDFRSLFEGRD